MKTSIDKNNSDMLALFQAHLDAWSTHGKDTNFEFLHKDAVYEFPYDPNDKMRFIRGKNAIIDFIRTISKGATNWSFEIEESYLGQDSGVLWIVFNGSAISSKGSRPYNQSYCSLLKTKDDKIILYREYWNPDNLRKAFE